MTGLTERNRTERLAFVDLLESSRGSRVPGVLDADWTQEQGAHVRQPAGMFLLSSGAVTQALGHDGDQAKGAPRACASHTRTHS